MMNEYDIIVIGGDAAGMSAASQARRFNHDVRIAVFEKGHHVSYAACGMPYYISDDIEDHMSLVAIDKDDFTNKRNIHIFTESEVVTIDFTAKTITVQCENRDSYFRYSSLIIATGARAVIPPLDGIHNEGIFFLRNLYQGITIRDFIDNNKPGSGVIIGGGFIGLEMAEALRKRNIETTIIEIMESVAMSMSPDIREKIILELEEHHVSVMTGTSVNSIHREDDKLVLKTSRGDIKTDFIIVSVGIVPNTDFLQETPLALTEKGAIIVNEESKTNMALQAIVWQPGKDQVLPDET